MSKERTDEFLQWRGLVDQPDTRPDQVLDDKEATWQKLAERLGERRRNRLSSYRIAAACLLFALIIPAVRLFQDRHDAAGVHRRRQPEQQLSPVATSDVRRPHAATATTDAGGGATTAASTTSGGGVRVAGRDAMSSAAPASGGGVRLAGGRAATGPGGRTNRNRLPLLATFRVPPAFIVAAPPDSANHSLLPPSSQGPWMGVGPALRTKELKVVHQNEIRGGNMPSPSVGAAGSDRFINILPRTSGSPPTSAPPPTEDPALLKIKLSPSN
jgi:hypothetical protein